MKLQATDLVQGALYIHYGLTLTSARTVWIRGQLLLGMEFEGDRAAEALADWEGQEVPMVMAHDYRSLILALAKLAGGRL